MIIRIQPVSQADLLELARATDSFGTALGPRYSWKSQAPQKNHRGNNQNNLNDRQPMPAVRAGFHVVIWLSTPNAGAVSWPSLRYGCAKASAHHAEFMNGTRSRGGAG